MDYDINGTIVNLKMINRDYGNYKARRFLINNTNQNIWIPKGYVNEDGTIKDCYFKYNKDKFKEILHKASLSRKLV